MTVSKKAFDKQQEQLSALAMRVSNLSDELNLTKGELSQLKSRIGSDIGTIGQDVLTIVEHLRSGKQNLGNIG